MELTPLKYRTVVGIMPGVFYGLNVVLFASEGYALLRDWRLLQFASTIPVAITIPVVWYV